MLPELPKYPGVTDGGSADHDAIGFSVVEGPNGLFYGGDVAVGEDGAVDGLDGGFNEVVMNFSAVEFFYGTSVYA